MIINPYRFGGLPPLNYLEYVDLDGVSDYLNTPNSAGYAISGNFEVVIKCAANDWTIDDNDVIFSKYEAAQRSWAVHNRAEVSGSIQLTLSETGDSPAADWTSVKPTVADGTAIWLRVRWSASSGVCTIYYAIVADYPAPEDWITMNGTSDISFSSIFTGSAPLAVGGYGDGGRAFAGKIYHAELRQGFDGPVIARFNASQRIGGVYQNVPGEAVWTEHGSPVHGSD